MQRNPYFDPNPKPFSGPAFEWGDFESAVRVVRKVISRLRRANRVDPCLGVRVRPRVAARRRREQRRRVASNPSRGDPDLNEDAAALLGEVSAAGGSDPLDLLRAQFVVLHGWTIERFFAALDATIVGGRAFVFGHGDEAWLVRRGGA